ncbi:MAG: TlpA disulfide reductase family protein [Rikenellaceae bacterium]
MKIFRLTTIAIIAISVLTLIGCSNNKSLTIKGQILSHESKTLFLEQSIGGERIAIDSVKLSDIGEFQFAVKEANEDPTLYEIRYGWDRAPILGRSGEVITLTSIGRFASNYAIEGSVESEILREFYQSYVSKSDKLKELAKQYGEAQEKGESSALIAQDYSSLYYDIKREQLKFIVSNKGNMAALYAIFQRLPGDNNLINESSDLIYMRMVADSVEVNYPNSSYLSVLKSAIKMAEDREKLYDSITYLDFPEITMNDMFGEPHSLSSLHGSVILLDFWSAAAGKSNPNNAELKEIYEDYHQSGFEVYQVGIDTSKSIWVSAVQQQRLPWISVSDLKGVNSPSLPLYNITQLPANILISKEGEIVGRDLFGNKLREAVKKYSLQ